MIKTWTCEFCGDASFFATSACADHEEDCSYNPKNKTCDSCGNWYWDPNRGLVQEDGEPEGVSCCKEGLKPFRRDCDKWIER